MRDFVVRGVKEIIADDVTIKEKKRLAQVVAVEISLLETILNRLRVRLRLLL